MKPAQRPKRVTRKRTDDFTVRRAHELHRKRLQSMRSVVDNRPPKPQQHLKHKRKKEQMLEGECSHAPQAAPRWAPDAAVTAAEWYARVERENRLLLEKMSHIMARGGVDNVNNYHRYSRSLNHAVRKREIERIASENASILSRIQERGPVYDRREWDRQWREEVGHIRRITEFNGLPALRPRDAATTPPRRKRVPPLPRPSPIALPRDKDLEGSAPEAGEEKAEAPEAEESVDNYDDDEEVSDDDDKDKEEEGKKGSGEEAEATPAADSAEPAAQEAAPKAAEDPLE